MDKEKQTATILNTISEVEADIEVLKSNLKKAKEYLSQNIEDIDEDYFDQHFRLEQGLKHIRLFN